MLNTRGRVCVAGVMIVVDGDTVDGVTGITGFRLHTELQLQSRAVGIDA